MSTIGFIDLLTYFEPALCAVGLAAIWRSGQKKRFGYLFAFLTVRLCSFIICLPLLELAGRGIKTELAYDIYFYVYWSSYAVQSVLGLLLIYSMFNAAMEPLEGLKSLGVLIFRWIACISAAVSLEAGIIPHVTGLKFIVMFVTQLQRTQSILTLCLLLFVCFAIRPMGLSQKSRVFGVSLGLGVLATANLAVSSWMTQVQALYSVLNLFNGLATCASIVVWTVYFALPEPKRRIIVLPTTSPFLRWNQISEVLGDEPGFVAIAGIPPELFAPAELEVMRRASLKIADQPVISLEHSLEHSQTV